MATLNKQQSQLKIQQLKLKQNQLKIQQLELETKIKNDFLLFLLNIITNYVSTIKLC